MFRYYIISTIARRAAKTRSNENKVAGLQLFCTCTKCCYAAIRQSAYTNSVALPRASENVRKIFEKIENGRQPSTVNDDSFIASLSHVGNSAQKHRKEFIYIFRNKISELQLRTYDTNWWALRFACLFRATEHVSE